jgi:hypothetical protein
MSACVRPRSRSATDKAAATRCRNVDLCLGASFLRHERPADGARRFAIMARLNGTSASDIARSLGVKPATVKSYLTSCGVTMLRSYCLNPNVAEALNIDEIELRRVGARWNGRYWVGRGPYQGDL